MLKTSLTLHYKEKTGCQPAERIAISAASRTKPDRSRVELFRFVGSGDTCGFNDGDSAVWRSVYLAEVALSRCPGDRIWFASCNACLTPHQNCRSLVIAPDGTVAAQSELQREQLVVADIDIDRATRAMFRYDLDACAELLFADTVRREEFASALSQGAHDVQHL